MEKTKIIAPMRLEMLFAIVHNDKVAYYSSIIQSHMANLQLSVAAKGTTHMLLDYLGFTERPKTMIMSMVRADQAGALIETLDEQFKKGKNYKGLAFTLPLSSIIGTRAYGFLSDDQRTVKQEV